MHPTHLNTLPTLYLHHFLLYSSFCQIIKKKDYMIIKGRFWFKSTAISDPDSDIPKILEISEQKFKIAMIKVLKTACKASILQN